MTQCDCFVRDGLSHTPECLVAREGVSRAVWGGVDGGESLGFPLELEVCLNVVLLPVHPLAAHQPLLLLLLHPHPPAHVAAGPRPFLPISLTNTPSLLNTLIAAEVLSAI